MSTARRSNERRRIYATWIGWMLITAGSSVALTNCDNAVTKTRWFCYDSTGDGTGCTCDFQTQDMIDDSAEHGHPEIPSCDTDIFDQDLCCAGGRSSEHPAYFDSCLCFLTTDASCEAAEPDVRDVLHVVDCSQPVGYTPVDTSGTGPNPTCPNRGSCGLDNDRCACGLRCIQYTGGNYLCGDPCSEDIDCLGKSEPTTGQPYARCVQPEGFCN